MMTVEEREWGNKYGALKVLLSLAQKHGKLVRRNKEVYDAWLAKKALVIFETQTPLLSAGECIGKRDGKECYEILLLHYANGKIFLFRLLTYIYLEEEEEDYEFKEEERLFEIYALA